MEGEVERETQRKKESERQRGKEAERKAKSKIRSSSSGNNDHNNTNYYILDILHIFHLIHNRPAAEVFHFHFPDEETELRESK